MPEEEHSEGLAERPGQVWLESQLCIRGHRHLEGKRKEIETGSEMWSEGHGTFQILEGKVQKEVSRLSHECPESVGVGWLGSKWCGRRPQRRDGSPGGEGVSEK